jgi:hypothetical protein
MPHSVKLRAHFLVLCSFCSILCAPVAYALPATIDSDAQIRLAGTSRAGTGGYTNFAGEGWLHLALENGSQVKYVGTFTDNLDSGKQYAAKADATTADAAVLQVFTRFGKFVFTMDSNFGADTYFSKTTNKVPSNYSATTNCYLFGSTHGYTTVRYDLFVDFVVGIPNGKASTNGMVLTLIKDSNGFIAPRDPFTHSVSSLSIPTTPEPIFTRITGPGYFGTIFSNGGAADGFYLNLPYFERFIVLSGSRSGSDDSFFTGGALISGSKTAAAIGTFVASKQPSQ